MANVGITEEAVFAAAQELSRQGIDPTIQAVRDKLGTGSFTTVSKHLKAWEQKVKHILQTPKVPLDVMNYMNQLWAAAFREAQNLLESDKKAFQASQEKWEQEKVLVLHEIEKLEVEKTSASNRCKDLEKELERREAQKKSDDEFTRKFQAEIAKLQAKLEASEDRRKESTDRADRLENELATIAKSKK